MNLRESVSAGDREWTQFLSLREVLILVMEENQLERLLGTESLSTSRTPHCFPQLSWSPLTSFPVSLL